MSERVLVTGGAGFMGAHLCNRLLDMGAAVEVWRRPQTTSALPHWGPGEVELHDVDIRSADAVAQALHARPPDTVFHLAGIRLRGDTSDMLTRSFDTNVLGTMNLVGNLNPDTRVVVIGTCEEYGRGPIPYREAQPAQPETAYSISRMAATLACLSIPQPRTTVLRLSIVYGPGQTGEMFIPALMRACVAGEEFAMTSGEQTRDLLYVADAVEAMCAVAEQDAAIGEIVNAGSSVECSIRKVAEQVARLLENQTLIRFGAIDSPAAEARRYLVDTEKIRSMTNWEPTVSLSDGLARTLSWWQERTGSGS